MDQTIASGGSGTQPDAPVQPDVETTTTLS